MDPDRYYSYTDLGTVDKPQPKAASDDVPTPAEADDGAVSIVYQLDQLSVRRPGPVLAAGYGNLLKAVVRAANAAEVRPLFTTGTDDKLRAFTFGGSTNTVSLGKRFDTRLFTNEFCILEAATICAARTILWAVAEAPSDLLRRECEERHILLLMPLPGDRTYTMWERASAPATDEPYTPVVWRCCPHCGFSNDGALAEPHGWACPTCGALYRLSTDERMQITFDAGSVQEWDTQVPETDPMGYPDYDAVIARAKERSGYDEAVRCGKATIEGSPVAFGIMEPAFMMGSMGHVVGEKLARMIEKATAEQLPVVIFCASGGARMQEGLASLMQMAKVSAAIDAHDRAGLLYISVITDPTTGGVTASFAMLGDIILAEPHALIGFAGRRVIQDTIKQALPEDFQTAEFALEHGLIDAIVERLEMRSVLGQILRLHDKHFDHTNAATSAEDSEAVEVQEEEAPAESVQFAVEQQTSSPLQTLMSGLSDLRDLVGQAVSEQTSNATLWWALRNQGVADIPSMKPASSSASDEGNRAWESVQLARNAHRPTSSYYIASMMDDFIELHGDRAFADDGAIIGGIGLLGGHPVTVVAQEKGSDLKERIARNFGCPQPEGYRKAQRLMQQAEKFGRPIVCLVDTQGAFCGKEAEERGMGNAIAESLAQMAGLTVPVVSVVLGEGGSGGALALAVANRVAMQENAVYSVLSPEGFASILWKDGSRAPEAASVMKMSAADALEMGMIEDVIPEGTAPAHENPDQAAAAVWLYITTALEELLPLTKEELREQRYARFRRF